MTFMNSIEKEILVARLDGFLSGVAAVNGKIRDYTAFSRLVESKDEGCSAEASIKSFFNWMPNMAFSEIKLLGNGLRDLETEIRPFLVRDLAHISPVRQLDLQRYLSFRVMEMVHGVVGGVKDANVSKLVLDSDESSSECVFFCICIEGGFVFLQFNNDIKFKEARPVTIT